MATTLKDCKHPHRAGFNTYGLPTITTLLASFIGQSLRYNFVPLVCVRDDGLRACSTAGFVNGRRDGGVDALYRGVHPCGKATLNARD